MNTPLTHPDFLSIFNRLCVALRELHDDTGITQDVYWHALRDVSLESLGLSAEALSKEPGRKWFPTTSEWRTAANRAADDLRRAEHVSTGREWHDECRDCSDTGWVKDLTCDGSAYGACGRPRLHGAHTYTVPCPCRPTNRTYQRRHA